MINLTKDEKINITFFILHHLDKQKRDTSCLCVQYAMPYKTKNIYNPEHKILEQQKPVTFYGNKSVVVIFSLV